MHRHLRLWGPCQPFSQVVSNLSSNSEAAVIPGLVGPGCVPPPVQAEMPLFLSGPQFLAHSSEHGIRFPAQL